MIRRRKRKRVRGGETGNEVGIIQLTPAEARTVENDYLTEKGGNLQPKRFSALPKRVRKKFFRDSPNFIRGGSVSDGTCFYHTLAQVTNIDDYFHKSEREQGAMGRAFRKKIHDRITEDAWKHFWKKKNVEVSLVPDLKGIKDQMKNPTTWADVFAILWVCDLLDLNLLVFDMESHSLYCGTFEAKIDRPTILMAWIQHAHFEPILEWDAKKMRLRTLFSRRREGPTILDHLIRMYEKQGCPGVTIHEILRRRRRRRRQQRRRQRRR